MIRIAILISAALLPLGMSAQPAAAREAAVQARVEASAMRAGDMVDVRWDGLALPVSVAVSDAPNAGWRDSRKLVQVFEGSAARVSVAAAPRAYFLLRDARGREFRVAERVLPLEGGNNFRDLGGYPTSDGRQVRWGKLYRSAAMNGLTADDFRYLGQLGISTVCDFRATDERASAPVKWPAGVQPKVLTREYALDLEALMMMFSQPGVDGPRAKAAMAAFCREMPFMFKDQFAEMFRELVAGRAPLAFNCSAGKDRTGLAAVLVLSALGVPRETAISDYLLSNTYYRPQAPKPGAAPDAAMAMLAKLPPDAIKVLMGVDRSYMEASLAAIDEKGGMDRYLREDMGLSDADRARLKALYLTAG